MYKEGCNYRGQISVFVIIALIIISGVSIYFLVRGTSTSAENIPANIEPVYNQFKNCLEDVTKTGIALVETSGGYLDFPEFEAGSRYMPFSSYFDFSGMNIPYWYYVSGNNIQRENVPKLSDMEDGIAKFVNSKIRKCVFDEFYSQGFFVSMGEPEARVNIQGKSISLDLKMALNISKADETIFIRNHNLQLNSELGELYDSALSIYNYEMQKMFLEEYGVDSLRTYGPVDGVELTCAPLTWNAEEVFNKISEAVEQNILAIKLKGGDYTLNNPEKNYFVVDLDVGKNVRFLNSRNWTSSFDVSPSQGPLMISKPIGNQQGVGVLGFCFVPYHFVYNLNYPVLIQVYSTDGSEVFQFPMAIVIKGNKPREPLPAVAIGREPVQICESKNNLVTVNLLDLDYNSLDGEVFYKCSGVSCEIGKTSSGIISEMFPQCVNGYIIAEVNGYKPSKQLFSSLTPSEVDIFLEKLYEKEVKILVDGKEYSGEAILTITSNGSSQTIVYPNQKKINLSAGQFDFDLSVNQNSTIRIEATTNKQCANVPREGIAALFGGTEERCFDMEIPAQILSSVLFAGGKQTHYILESELKEKKFVEISTTSMPVPKSLEQLQENYALFEAKKLDINLK